MKKSLLKLSINSGFSNKSSAVAMNKSIKQMEAELIVLKTINENPGWSQRQVSSELGLSLGKTNYIFKALLSKGWVKAKNFKRSDNKLSYLYLLTPKGITEKSKLTENFLKIKSDEYNRLKQEIEILKSEL